jgi:NDP-sugar pyrophosphorylase family protein
MKYEILKNQQIQVTHPNTLLPIKLFRIIALRDISVTVDGTTYNIKSGTIGGYVQSERNLPQDDSGWIAHDAAVLDSAVVKDSYVTDSAKIFGNAVVENCRIAHRAVVEDRAIVQNSKLSENVIISDSGVVTDSTIKNASRVEGQSVVNNSSISGGSRVYNSRVYNSTFEDQAEAIESTVRNCHFSGRTVCKMKNVDGERRDEQIELTVKTQNNV